jgi:hypothetical protein
MVPDPDLWFTPGWVGSEMPALDRLVQKTDMTAEEIGRLREAYELVLREIGVKDRDDPLTESVAKEVVEAGRARPMHHPLELCRLVVKRLGM